MPIKVGDAEELRPVPVGLFMGIVQGETATNAKVATGDYNDMLDKIIAAIKMKCGVK